MRLSAGSPARLGASWDGRGTNFALFSANAEKVELCLFDGQGRRELERIELPERNEDVWHGYLNDVSPGQLYGYRVHGPYAPEHGHRFNANKLLLDPYAKRLAGRLVWSDAHFGYRTGSAREDLSFDRRDNARGMPKAVVVDETFNWGRREIRPNIAWEDTIIYEAHVKGLTQKRGDVAPGWRGTYGGLCSPAMIDHLKKLGVTTIELLPIHGLIDDRVLVERKLANYWGYNTLAFFAPEPRYAQDNALDAFRTTVARLHDAGIEVMLDVVYNHTAEGNHLGPTLSFRGIDNASYYWLNKENPRYYDDFTGCGSSVNLTHPRVLQMVMDSLRYWVEVCHVDGFRFDLATTLARGPNGFDRNSSFLTAVRQDPVLATVKLVAEPWDLGMGGYQVGAFPSQWSEWNDRYRSAMRRYWSGEGSLIGEVSRRMTASSDLFHHDNRATRASVNHITVHDGFTLADLFSYNDKHNEANGEDNRDGSNDNHSNNCGHEGPTSDAAIVALRRQLRKNQLACLFLALGTPADAGRRRGRQFAERQQQRLLPGQRDRLGELGQSRQAGRRPHRFRRPHDRAAPALRPAPQSALARWAAQGWLLWRAVADARGRGNEGSRLEFSGRPIPRLCARADGTRAGADLYRAERRTRRDRFHIAADDRIQELAAGAEHDRGRADRHRTRFGRRNQSAAAVGACLCGRGMNDRQFGPCLASYGTRFRLWAPAAKRVDVMLEQPHAMKRGEDGWFTADIAGVKAGARYKFRIDDEIDVPDPASAFQPDDVFGPSEVIDHEAYPWRATNWRGRPWQEAVIVEAHVGTFTRARQLSRDDRQARSSRRDRHHRAGIDAAGGFRRLPQLGL